MVRKTPIPRPPDPQDNVRTTVGAHPEEPPSKTTERDFRKHADGVLRDRLRRHGEESSRVEPTRVEPTRVEPTEPGHDATEAQPMLDEQLDTFELSKEQVAAEMAAAAAVTPPDLGLMDTARPAAPVPAPIERQPSGRARTPIPPPPEPEAIPAPRAAAVAAAPAVAPARANVVVMFGCRGGCGTTTLAINAAAVLARAGKKVCVVDLDLQLGDVFVSLNLEPVTSIVRLSRDLSSLSDAALMRRLAQHGTGVCALSQVGNVSEIDPELAQRIPALLSRLSSVFDLVIVDGPRDFDDFALNALDSSARIVAVVTQDVPAMRRAARALSIMRQLGYPESRIKLVVNRHDDAHSVIDDAAVEKALRLPVSARVRNDHGTVRSAIDRGLLLQDVAPRAGVTSDVGTLAALIAGEALPAQPAQPRPGLLSRLFGRRS